jgi:hypothetical protein
MGMAGRASLRWRGIRQSENKPLSVMADCRPFYQPHIDWRIFNSSRPMHCSTGLEMSKTASTSAIALLAMAKITRSWSVKSMVSPPMLVTAAKAAVVRFSDSAGV